MGKVMDGLNSIPWIRVAPLVNSWIVEIAPIPRRDKGKYGYDLWSNGLAFEAFGIGRTHKISIRAPGYGDGMWLLNFDTQGRLVNASYTGKKWGQFDIPAPKFEFNFRLLPYPRYRPEMHRLVGGTWLRAKWTDQIDSSRLVYRAEIVPNDDPFYEAAMFTLDELIAALSTSDAEWSVEAAEAVQALRLLPLKTNADLLGEANIFHSIINVPDQISVEPPELAFDHYHAIPVKVQGGCGGPCTFCTLFDRKINVLPTDVIERQIDMMAEYLGEELDHFVKVVLLEGDALTVPSQQLGQTLSYAKTRFGIADGPFAHAFSKGITVAQKSPEELKYLRSQGLLNVNIGLETGSQEILNLVKRGQKVTHCREAIQKLLDAKIGVSVNVIAGMGGARLFDQHVRETLAFFRDLPAAVTVFYATLQVHPEMRYAKQGFGDLAAEELAQQIQVFRRELAATEYLFVPM